MKGFFFLSLVGAALYAALLVSHDYLPSDRGEHPVFAQSLGNAGERQLRSWGSDLPALAISGPQPSRQPTAAPRLVESSQNSAPPGGVAESQARTAFPEMSGTAFMPTESAKVIAARVHSRPYVSSPIVRFYHRGTALQVVDRENGWVQVADPTSGEEGWVLEKYLTDVTSVTNTAMETETGKPLKESTRTKPVSSAKKRARTPRPVTRGSESVALVQFDKRWEGRAERRGGFGLFIFGRFARAQ
jgi:Bacterial SH3 domain